jgi:signal transduction histidine kinase
MRSILLVDDDFGNLALLEEYLSDDYQVITAMSGMEAMQILQAKEFDIIISDQRMPQMSGVELLEHARKMYPDTIRMILSAYSDANAMLAAINQGHVYRFLLKPWEHTDLAQAIHQGLDYRDTLRANRRLASKLRRRNQQVESSHEQLEAAEKELVRSAKLATIGQIASGVMNQLERHREDVSAIEEAIAGVEVPEPIAGRVKKGLSSLSDVFRTVDELLAFARLQRQGLSRTWFELDEVVREALEVARVDAARQPCRVTESLGAPPPVYADRDKLSLALAHLITNSLQMAGEHGVVTLCTDEVPGGVAITVSDDGPGVQGMDAEESWEPIYTTRADGSLGLGLEICRLIVGEHGGNVEMEATPGVGTVWTLALPVGSEER